VEFGVSALRRRVVEEDLRLVEPGEFHEGAGECALHVDVVRVDGERLPILRGGGDHVAVGGEGFGGGGVDPVAPLDDRAAPQAVGDEGGVRPRLERGLVVAAGGGGVSGGEGEVALLHGPARPAAGAKATTRAVARSRLRRRRRRMGTSRRPARGRLCHLSAGGRGRRSGIRKTPDKPGFSTFCWG
jgi:hypothetical protein